MTKRRSSWPKVAKIFRRKARQSQTTVPDDEVVKTKRSFLQRCRRVFSCFYPRQVHPDMAFETMADRDSGSKMTSPQRSPVISVAASVKSLKMRSPSPEPIENDVVDLNLIDIEEQEEILKQIIEQNKERIRFEASSVDYLWGNVPGPSDRSKAIRVGKSDGHLEAKVNEQEEQNKQEVDDEVWEVNKRIRWYFPTMKNESKYIKSMAKADEVRERREREKQISKEANVIVRAAIYAAFSEIILR